MISILNSYKLGDGVSYILLAVLRYLLGSMIMYVPYPFPDMLVMTLYYVSLYLLIAYSPGFNQEKYGISTFCSLCPWTPGYLLSTHRRVVINTAEYFQIPNGTLIKIRFWLLSFFGADLISDILMHNLITGKPYYIRRA